MAKVDRKPLASAEGNCERTYYLQLDIRHSSVGFKMIINKTDMVGFENFRSNHEYFPKSNTQIKNRNNNVYLYSIRCFLKVNEEKY